MNNDTRRDHRMTKYKENEHCDTLIKTLPCKDEKEKKNLSHVF